MNINLTKSVVLEAGLQKQQSIIADFRKRVLDVMVADGREEYETHQRTYNAEVLAEVNILNKEIEFASQELSEMRRIDCTHEHQKAEYGAVVKTNKKNFFVSASLEDFTVGSQHFFGISVHSPIYLAMKGKKQGERFKARNVEYVIEGVF